MSAGRIAAMMLVSGVYFHPPYLFSASFTLSVNSLWACPRAAFRFFSA